MIALGSTFDVLGAFFDSFFAAAGLVAWFFAIVPFIYVKKDQAKVVSFCFSIFSFVIWVAFCKDFTIHFYFSFHLLHFLYMRKKNSYVPHRHCISSIRQKLLCGEFANKVNHTLHFIWLRKYVSTLIHRQSLWLVISILFFSMFICFSVIFVVLFISYIAISVYVYSIFFCLLLLIVFLDYFQQQKKQKTALAKKGKIHSVLFIHINLMLFSFFPFFS